MSWIAAATEAARAKLKEEQLRVRLLPRYRADRRVAPRIREVMGITAGEVEQGTTSADPRSIPGNPTFVASGWAEHMLLRYLLPLEQAANARVLDTCCGLGWGSYLVASVAAQVIGLDIDSPSIDYCTRRWGGQNLTFRAGSVLDLPFEDDSFDVVLCMDAIEHFALPDGARFLAELERVCRGRGYIFGSSAFPETRWGADRLCSKNPHHLYVYTRQEMIQLLGRTFGHPRLVTRHYFQAIKS